MMTLHDIYLACLNVSPKCTVRVFHSKMEMFGQGGKPNRVSTMGLLPDRYKHVAVLAFRVNEDEDTVDVFIEKEAVNHARKN